MCKFYWARFKEPVIPGDDWQVACKIEDKWYVVGQAGPVEPPIQLGKEVTRQVM